MNLRLWLSLACTLGCAVVHADNWGHWRGPIGNGVAIDAQPPTTWSPTENIAWKVEVPGRGSGSPVVWGDQVFVVTAISDGASAEMPTRGRGFDRRRGGGESITKKKFVLFAYDRSTGKLNWSRVATQATPHQGTHPTNGFASASPCTDGEYVYAHFGSRGLFCYRPNGELVWKRDDFGRMQTGMDLVKEVHPRSSTIRS